MVLSAQFGMLHTVERVTVDFSISNVGRAILDCDSLYDAFGIATSEV